MSDESRRFVEEFANPHSWLLIADELHEQAIRLNDERNNSSVMTRTNGNGIILRQTVGIDRSVFLLGGFALENAIKSFLVYENPQWVSGAILARKLRSHSLVSLKKLSKTIPYQDEHLWILNKFESGLDSWFRYPCGLSFATSLEGEDLSSDLWDGYKKVMAAYGKKLTSLLAGGWHGPHGFYGRWEFQGAFLGYERPIMENARKRD